MMISKVSLISLVVLLLTLSSCIRRADVKAPNNLIRTERFSYVKDEHGRWYIVTSTSRDFDEAIKSLRPGPASVDKLHLWIVTPLERQICNTPECNAPTPLD